MLAIIEEVSSVRLSFQDYIRDFIIPIRFNTIDEAWVYSTDSMVLKLDYPHEVYYRWNGEDDYKVIVLEEYIE